MKLTAPCIITPRLLPGLRIGDAMVSIEIEESEPDGRVRYRWYVDLDGKEYSDNDMRSGCQGGTLQAGLASLLSFLGAFAEAQRYPDSESRDLFPAELADWATEYSDVFAMAADDMEQGEYITED